jgi:hypothetical protein
VLELIIGEPMIEEVDIMPRSRTKPLSEAPGQAVDQVQPRASEAPGPASTSEEALAPLAEAIGAYRSRLPELLQEHEGEYVLIVGTEVRGFFPDESSALSEGYSRFGIVPFLVRQVAVKEPIVYLPNVVP